jgi:hypothetical protein
VQFNVFANLSKGENHMLRYLVVTGVILWMAVSATNVWSIEVVDAVITTAVIDRRPVDQVKAFPIRNGKLYCFTRIIGAEDPTEVYHVWYRGEQLISRIKLPVNSPDWRTWSAKRFLEDWSGEWRVEIQDVDGNLLQKINFQLR